MTAFDNAAFYGELRRRWGPLKQAQVDDINAALAKAFIAEPETVASALPAPHPKLSAEIIMAAQAGERKWGIPASVSLAQYAVESAWGTKMSGKNNPFGIKDTDGKNATTLKTREETKGGDSYYINAGFENFSSIAEAFDVHGKLLGTAKAYTRARAALPDADAFADALTGVYATANNYGSVLKGIMRTQGLYQYNLGEKA